LSYTSGGKLTRNYTVFGLWRDTGRKFGSFVQSGDVAAPTRDSAVVSADGQTYTITYSESIQSAAGDPHDGITIKDGATTMSIASSVISGADLIITLSGYIGKNNGSPTDEYDSTAANSDITDAALNEVATYSATAAANNSAMLLVDAYTNSDSTLLTDHTPTDLNDSGNSYENTTGTPDIQSNKEANGICVLDTGEYAVKMTVIIDSQDPSNGTAGINFRYLDGNNQWSCYMNVSSGDIELWSRKTGTWTKESTVAHTPSGGESLIVTDTGSVITFSIGADSNNLSDSTGGTVTKQGPNTGIGGNGRVDYMKIEAL
jgi:hypothetical protein